VPLQRAGVRIGLHAKSMVVDERIGVIGTHNFDPRGDRYNTESAVVIDDPAFARALADSIRGDMRPGERLGDRAARQAAGVFRLDYSIAKVSEALPIFDLWPWRTRPATSSCPVPMPGAAAARRSRLPPLLHAGGPVPRGQPAASKGLTTRIFTAFGAGLAPIL
jgi:putative cardiolipin synthase